MLPNYYEFFNPVKIISGLKALDNLPFELDQQGSCRPIIITDQGVVNADLIKFVKKAFDSSEMTIGAIYDNVPPDSSIEVVNEIVEIYRNNNCDSIVAVGGGSPMDTAKGVNIVITENSDDLIKFAGVDMLKQVMKPLIVIPTTAGTGSEVTPVAVIANRKNNVKMLFTSCHLFPRVAILDSRMTLTMPPHITAATGMDALTHAMEGYFCLQKNPMSDAYSFAAINLIREYLIKAVKNGDDKEARLAMANAATMAGASFANSMVGMVHSLGHSLGAVCHIPHGIAMSIFLPFALEYNMAKIEHQLAELLLPFGGPDEYSATPSSQRASRTIVLVRKLQQVLNEICGMPFKLKDAGVSKNKFEEIARTALND